MERARGAIRRADGSGARRRARRAATAPSGALPVDDVRVGDVVVVRPGEKIPLDGRVAAGDEPREPGAGDRRVAAGRESGRATRCSPARSTAAARSRSRVDAAARRLDAGAHHPPRRARAGAARAEPDLRRSLRARLHAGGAGPGRRSSRSCRRSLGGGSWSDVDLSRARAARHLLPVRAGHLDAGLDRVGAGRGGAQGRADQGRRAPRAARGRALRRVRQDRHADEGPAPRRRRRRRSTASTPRARSCSSRRRSRRGPSIRSARAIVGARGARRRSRSRRSTRFQALPGLRRRSASSAASRVVARQPSAVRGARRSARRRCTRALDGAAARRPQRR